MILKVNLLLDVKDSIITSEVITNLLNQVFIDNSHLARMIICEVFETERKHEFVFYVNGSFCKYCNQPIGTPYPCE